MARPIIMPSLGMFTAEGTLTTWLWPTGTPVTAGQAVAELTTEKATYEIEAPADGLLHQVAAVGAVMPVQGLLGYVLAPGESPPAGADGPTTLDDRPTSPPAPAAGTPRPAGEIKATPVARRLAAQHAIDLASVSGSGPGGRIIEADVLAAVARAAPPSGPRGDSRAGRRRPLTGIRRTIGARLRQSLSTAAPVTLMRAADAEALVATRARLSDASGRACTYDALFVAVLAAALRQHPAFNALIDGDEIVELDEIHIGVAVDTPAGLLVPVVHHADRQVVTAIDARVTAMAERARAGTLQPDDLGGATATVTNLGGLGVDAFTPILNPPQTVILGLGRIRPQPVWDGGAWLPRRTCHLSLTFDHRVSDGAPAARLLESVAGLMADETWLSALA